MASGWRQSIRIVEENFSDPERSDIEIVERKGVGHPDTLAELVADEFIRCYAEYSLRVFGAVPNVSVDKTAFIGALASLRPGAYAIKRKGRALLVGKITSRVGAVDIPVDDLFHQSVANVLDQAGLAELLKHMSLEVVNNDRHTDDHAREMYHPSSVADIRSVDPAFWESADTACVSFEGPLTSVERLVIDLEQELTGERFRFSNPEFGTDVKVLATRHGRSVDVTLCVPVKASVIASRGDYLDALEKAHVVARGVGDQYSDLFSLTFQVNTKDITGGAYLTALGSSLDKGDQGATGRGNGPLGVNSIERRKSAEVVAGKNPFNHPAKLYTHLARTAIADIVVTDRVPVRIAITCRNGEPLMSPSNVFIQLGGRALEGRLRSEVFEAVADHGETMLADLGNVSERLALVDPVEEFRSVARRQAALAVASNLTPAGE